VHRLQYLLTTTRAIAGGVLVTVTMAGCSGGSPPGSPEPDTGGWVSLFNGSDLDGWRTYAEDAPRPAWIVEDDTIKLDVAEDEEDTTGGDLITERQFENFELELEWKITEGGNSGIFFGVRELPGQDVAYLTGVEVQILDDANHADGTNPLTSAGACYALYPPPPDVTHPVGEWNAVRLVVQDGRVEHWLNGRKIVEYDMNSEDWQARVAESKFADWEHFGRYRSGHIALQDHTDPVWFRNIRIREL
jgi:hypothetical protein